MRYWGLAVMALAAAAVGPAASAGSLENDLPPRYPSGLVFGGQVARPPGIALITSESLSGAGTLCDLEWSPPGDRLLAFWQTADATRVSILTLVDKFHDTWQGNVLHVPGSYQCALWWPDASKFALCTAGQPADRDQRAPSEIWEIYADGKSRSLLFSSRLKDAAAMPPLLSPDGAKIAIVGEPQEVPPGEQRVNEVVILDVGTKSATVVGENGWALEFSADGKALSYVTGGPDIENPEEYYLVRCDLRTGEKTQRSTAWRKHEYRLSPDGSKAAQIIPKAPGDLVVRDMTSGVMARLTLNADVSDFAWSPDSLVVAYVSKYTVTDESRRPTRAVPMLWAVAAAGPDTGRRVLLSPLADESVVPIWSPDGRFVAFGMGGDVWVAGSQRPSYQRGQAAPLSAGEQAR